MSTLKTFQAEIEEIHNREMAKQRARIATSPMEKAKETVDQKPAAVTQARHKADESLISSKSVAGVSAVRTSLLELEDKILV